MFETAENMLHLLGSRLPKYTFSPPFSSRLTFKSATDHLYNVRNESTEWVTLDFEDPNMKYMLNGNASKV